MNKKATILEIKEKKLVGHALEMSLINNKTQELFSGFMPIRKQITNATSSDIYEVLVYNQNYFENFNPSNTFTKWAAREVESLDNVPSGMVSFTLEKGLYAVFLYKGLAKDFSVFMQYILMEWLPKSQYILDNRPHYNLLGSKTKKNSPNSEEEVYIPIKQKS